MSIPKEENLLEGVTERRGLLADLTLGPGEWRLLPILCPWNGAPSPLLGQLSETRPCKRRVLQAPRGRRTAAPASPRFPSLHASSLPPTTVWNTKCHIPEMSSSWVLNCRLLEHDELSHHPASSCLGHESSLCPGAPTVYMLPACQSLCSPLGIRLITRDRERDTVT